MATWEAASAGMPTAVSPEYRAPGRLRARPTMTMLKKRDMLTRLPAFWMVARMPDATRDTPAGPSS